MNDWKSYAIIILAGIVTYLLLSKPNTVTIREVGCVDHVARVMLGGLVKDVPGITDDWFVEIPTNDACRIIDDVYARTIESAKTGKKYWPTEEECAERLNCKLEELRKKNTKK